MRSLLATITAAFMVASSMLRAVCGLPSVSQGAFDACTTVVVGSTQLPDGTVCATTDDCTVNL
eukprot:507168-Prymnesium_polylepis.3